MGIGRYGVFPSKEGLVTDGNTDWVGLAVGERQRIPLGHDLPVPSRFG